MRGDGIIDPFSPDLPLGAARDHVAAILAATGLPDARLEARFLVEDATGLGRSALTMPGAATPIGPATAATLTAWVARRLGGEPLFRILGRREFWGLDLRITPDVLDPRPDTETVVEAALTALGPRRAAALRIVDLGIGSGAILAALLSECPDARGLGVDRSFAAARVASQNLTALGLSARAVILQGFWGDALATGAFDLVVSNPPYIETAVIPTLDHAVRDHDPHGALDGGPDGLACYRTITADLPRLLAPGGHAVLEVGASQAAAVRALGEAAGLLHRTTRHDLAGHARAVVLQRA